MVKSSLDSKKISQYLREIQQQHLDLYINDSDINANLAAKVFLRLEENARNFKINRLDLDNKKLVLKLQKALTINPMLYWIKNQISKSANYYLFSMADAFNMLEKVFGKNFISFCTYVDGDVNRRCKISSQRNLTDPSYIHSITLLVAGQYFLKCSFIIFASEEYL